MLALKPFTPISSPLEVFASLQIQDSRWFFEFRLRDPRGEVVEVGTPGLYRDWSRADGLWQTTCFEAFVARKGEAGYWEFNFSPGRKAWNVYRFDQYRLPQPPRASGDFELEEVSAQAASLRCTLDAKTKANLPLEVGLTAVIKTGAGVSYFALTHAAAKADFHERASFSLKL